MKAATKEKINKLLAVSLKDYINQRVLKLPLSLVFWKINTWTLTEIYAAIQNDAHKEFALTWKNEFCIEKWFGHWHPGNFTHLRTGHVGKTQGHDDLCLGGTPVIILEYEMMNGLLRSKFSFTIPLCRREPWGSFLFTSLSCRKFLRDICLAVFLFTVRQETFYLTPTGVQLLSYSMEFVPALQWSTACVVCHLAPLIWGRPVRCDTILIWLTLSV